MKISLKPVILGVVALAGVVIGTTVASAADPVVGPHSPSYFISATPDNCGYCHRPHRGQDEGFLALQQYALCTSCHDGSPATTNVVMGKLDGSTSQGLRGGGFEQVLMNTDTSEAVDPGLPAPVLSNLVANSTHSVDGTLVKAWGSGPFSAAPNPGTTDIELKCANCHNPHEQRTQAAGPDGLMNTADDVWDFAYRMLRPKPHDMPDRDLATTPFVIVPNQPAADARYDITYWRRRVTPILPSQPNTVMRWYRDVDAYLGVDPGLDPLILNPADKVLWPAAPADATVDDSARGAAISNWCSQCHTRYLSNGDMDPVTGAAVPTGDAIFTLRHKTTAGGFGGAANYTSPYCLKCHQVHGTGATATGYAADKEWPGGPVNAAGGGDPGHNSRLLQIDNNGICYRCHGWSRLSDMAH